MGTDESELTDLSLNSTAVLWGALPKLIASLTLQQDVLGSNSHACITSGSRQFAPRQSGTQPEQAQISLTIDVL